MAIVTIVSAKGSPGVTTAAMMTAALWPRPVILLDADPAGGDVALRWPAADGGTLDLDSGLLPLLTRARHGLAAGDLLAQTRYAAGGTPVICGLAAPEQAQAAAGLWASLARAAAEVRGADGRSADVIVDAGRITAQPVHLPLLLASSLLVMVLRADVAGVLHARERLRALAEPLRGRDGLRPRVGVVIVSDARQRSAEEAAEVVCGVGDWVHDLGRLPLDPAGAAVFAPGLHSRPERTALVRAGRGLVHRLAAAVDVQRDSGAQDNGAQHNGAQHNGAQHNGAHAGGADPLIDVALGVGRVA